MSSYFQALSEEMKDWKKAILVVIFTVGRLLYGYAWMKAGFEKATTWFSDGKPDAAGLIHGMVTAIGKSHGPDPLHINDLLVFVAKHIFLGMPYVTDVLVVCFEIGIGLLVFVGFRILIAALVAMFMNTQFAAAGSANNFGYIWTNLALLKFAKYAEAIGISGFLRFKKTGKVL